MKSRSGLPVPEQQTEEQTRGGIQHVGIRRLELTGRTLGDFVVRNKIGEGGFGLVYRAEQPLLEREAVIKVLQADDAKDGAMIQRFLREAKLASRLDHPFAAHTYAFGAEADGLLWIAMELVRGTPLNQLLEAQGPLPLHRFVPFFEKLCEVVQSAHEQGIIHRDLKPSNVMVISRAGRIFPKLLDLGIAKLRYESPGLQAASTGLDKEQTRTGDLSPMSSDLSGTDTFQGGPSSDPTSTKTTPSAMEALFEKSRISAMRSEVTAAADFQPGAGAVSVDITQAYLALGSPSYMAPEQWTDSASADARTDIYALGILAYQCLTGKKPFEGADALALRAAHMRLPVPSLGQEFPPKLDEVLRKAMAKRPAERFESALEFAREVRAASGLTDETPTLPQLDIEVREVFIAEGPQPLAETVALLEAARQSARAVEAARLTTKLAIRYVAILALASRARMGVAEAIQSDSLTKLFGKLNTDRLEDDEWWLLAQELCRPFATCRDAYPVPELVDLFFEPGSEQVRNRSETHLLLSNQPAEEVSEAQLASLLVELSKFLKKLFFLVQYPLAASRGREAEQWMGLRRPKRHLLPLQGQPPAEGQFLLSNAEGQSVLSLSPLIQVIAPTPGAAEEAFFLDGNGRLGARLVAFPVGFERYDESFWHWFRNNVSDVDTGGARKEDVEQAPYIGLSSFSTSQAGLFYGREREAESFSNRLRIQSLMGVVGPSGAGKSSFIQAGVVPLLASDWRVLTVRPGPSPISTLSAKLSADGVEVSNLRERLGENLDALGELLLQAAQAQGKTFLLVVDQFEELITLCADVAERNIYAQALSRAASSPERPVRVVLTLRDDFLIRVQQLQALRERLTQGLHLLGTPQREDLIRILNIPAQRSGYEFEDVELTSEMVDSVAEQPGALALLSFTASKLWDFRDRHLKRLTRKAYQALGGVGGALAHHAEATLGKMQPEEQRLVREAFRHLVTAEGTRAVLTRKEMAEVLGGGEIAESVLEQLIHARLLVASEGAAGEDRVEVIHEALLTSWPRLVKWQREDAENARMRDALRAGARQWSERGRVKGLLWRGEALLEYQLWRSRYPGSLTETEEAFAAASLREERRGRLIRRGLLVAAFVCLAVGMVILFRANGRAEANAKVAAERLIESYEEQGRRLVLEGKTQEALAYLSKAYSGGHHGVAIQYLIGKAMRALDRGQLILEGHTGRTWSARFSPDGRRVITASSDKTARIWDTRTGQSLTTLTHEGVVRSASFSPDGLKALTASLDGTARVWDAATGKLVFSIAHRPAILSAEFSHDGGLIATAGGDQTVQLWDARSGKRIASLTGHTSAVRLVHFSPDGKRLITTSDDNTAKLWDSDQRRAIATVVYDEEILDAQFSADGQRAVVAGHETARVLDAPSGKLLLTLAADAGYVGSAAFSPDGRYLATGGDDKSAKIWELPSGKLVHWLQGHNGGVKGVQFSPDGERIVTSSRDGTLRLWNARTGALLTPLFGHLEGVTNSEFSPAGDRIASAGVDPIAIIWDAKLTSFDHQFTSGKNDIADAVFSAQGNRLITVSDHKPILTVWDLQKRSVIQEFPLTLPSVDTLAVSANGDEVIAFDGKVDKSANLWRVATGKVVRKLVGHDQPLKYASFSLDGTRIVTGDLEKVLVHNASSGEIVLTLSSPTQYWSLGSFSPDGKRLATTHNNEALVWNLSTGIPQLTLSGHRLVVLRVAFSKDGRQLLTAAADLSVRTWDSLSGNPIHTFQGERQEFFDADLNNDSTLAAGAASGQAKFYVWDVATQKIVDIIVESSIGWRAAFSPLEPVLYTATARGGVKAWSVRLNTKSPAEIDSWLACYVPFRIEREQLVRSKPDPLACRR